MFLIFCVLWTLAVGGVPFEHDVRDVVVVESEWFVFDPPAPLFGASYKFPCESEQMRERYQTNRERCSEGNLEVSGLSQFGVPRDEAKRFVYELRIRNVGNRVISAVRWEYDFVDPKTGKLVSRHSFSSKTALKPGRTTLLSERSLRPPTPVIDIAELGSDDENLREIARVVLVDF